MKFFFVSLLVVIVLWIIFTVRKNRHNTDGVSGNTGGPDIAGNDYSPSHCGNDSGSCDGGGDGGGGD